MRYTMTLLESDFEKVRSHCNGSPNERAMYMTARLSHTSDETRILVRDVIPVDDADVIEASPAHLLIRSPSYVHAVKRSMAADGVFVFLHSHPKGPRGFSGRDDTEEQWLFEFALGRNPRPLHASLVFSEGAQIAGRVWLPEGRSAPIERIRIVGDHWRYFFHDADDTQVPVYFDRQVRLLGEHIQRLLRRLHVGVVGLGGTGSAVCEQLIRLGIGHLIAVDDDQFSATNVNRVYGSSIRDEGRSKTEILQRLAEHIGMGTRVSPIPKHLTFRAVAERLKDCDVVFGCTDDQWGRSILSRIAIYYFIPVLDLGVNVDSDGDYIRAIHGRVTILQPGTACLFCRGRISPEVVAEESVAATDPQRASALRAEGYVSGLREPAPAVVSFTSGIASVAVTEFLDRLIRFKTTETKSSELLWRFEADTIAKNSRPANSDCFCNSRNLWGAGDRKPFLGLTWRAAA